MTPHKHADVIHAWADGAEIEGRRNADGEWLRDSNPGWYIDWQYRIKPRTVKREGWIRLYKWANGSVVADSMLFDTEENAKRRNLNDCVATVRIEWEETE